MISINISIMQEAKAAAPHIASDAASVGDVPPSLYISAAIGESRDARALSKPKASIHPFAYSAMSSGSAAMASSAPRPSIPILSSTFSSYCESI